MKFLGLDCTIWHVRFKKFTTPSPVLLIITSLWLTFSAQAIPLQPASAQNSNPIAWYRASEASISANGDVLTVPDASGNGHHLQIHASRGGKLHKSDDAEIPRLIFPTPCDSNQRLCPRAILQGLPRSPDLNPGTARIKFGAILRISAHQTSDGSNVLQKGHSLTGSQYKLQIDGREGKPSCVLVNPEQIWLALSRVGVADGTWHHIECLRDNTSLTIFVDGIATGKTAVPATLDISNDDPLQIGGKGATQNNDQYFGELSEAFVAIGN